MENNKSFIDWLQHIKSVHYKMILMVNDSVNTQDRYCIDHNIKERPTG
jgi:hypothetical protein